MPFSTDYRPATIARSFVAAWFDHRRAIEEVGLSYIDELLAELRAERPGMSCGDLKQQLYLMIPYLKLGTAERLIALKYPQAVRAGNVRAA